MLEAFGAGMTVLEAARLVGVSSRTIYRWLEADPDFAAAVEEAKDKADDQVEAVTYAMCLDPVPANNGLRIFWLRSRRPETFGDKSKVDVTSGGERVQTILYIPSNGRDDDGGAEAPGGPPGDLPGDPG